MSQPLALLEEQYLTLMRNLGDLLKACQDEKQRDSVRTAYTTARDNFRKAQNQVFDENNAQVKALTAKLDTRQKEMTAALGHLEQIAGVLDTIAAAVKVGTSLAALV